MIFPIITDHYLHFAMLFMQPWGKRSELLPGVNEFPIFALPDALNTVGLGLIPNVGHLIFVDFSTEVNLAVFAGKLVILVRIIRVFNIKILATAYWTFHR